MTPSGEKYSEEKTPSNLFVNEYGKQVFRLPNLEAGNYTINVDGSDLGRVWVDNTQVGTGAAPVTDAAQPADATQPADTAQQADAAQPAEQSAETEAETQAAQ